MHTIVCSWKRFTRACKTVCPFWGFVPVLLVLLYNSITTLTECYDLMLLLLRVYVLLLKSLKVAEVFLTTATPGNVELSVITEALGSYTCMTYCFLDN